MKKICFLIAFVLFYNCSYPQTYKIEKITKEGIENIKINKSMQCTELSPYDYPISLIICDNYNLFRSSFITDTVIIIMECSIKFYFTDTTDYITIGNIRSKRIPDKTPFSVGKKFPKGYLKRLTTDFFNSRSFYYILRGKTIENFGIYYMFPIVLIPDQRKVPQ